MAPKKENRDKELRVNGRIRAPEVRVIGSDGAQYGILTVRDALKLAEEQGLDLVEVAPLAKPPVCKLIDYGKFKYEEKKKQAERRRTQTEVTLKELKLSPKTDSHDVEFKLNHARRFLLDGHKVKASVLFRGREMAHQDIGLEHLNKMMEALKDVGIVEQLPRIEGRVMAMILAPKKQA